MIPSVGLAVYAAGLALVVAAVVGFCLGSRPTALRSLSLAVGAAGVLLLRLLTAALEPRLGDRWELLLYTAFLLIAAGGLAPVEVWLIRTSTGEVKACLENGCRSLLLAPEWPTPRRFVLTVRGVEFAGSLADFGRFSLFWFPAPGKRGKPRLLVNWLAKQYPGPFPRPRIVLKRRQP